MDINILKIALISYILGSIPFALLFVKLFFKKDLRESGSKNTGALNTLRIISKTKGKLLGFISFVFVLILDAGKGVLAVCLAQNILTSNLLLATTLATFFAVLGHNHSLFLKLKGGRGAAVFIGILAYLNIKALIGWLILVLCFMFLFEALANRKFGKKFIKAAISDQIIGRLAGEIFAAFWLYSYGPDLFYPGFFATILIVVAHRNRLKDQIKKIKNKTYLNE